ncbi:imelysin family protein [Grimontia marina]|uniref:Imelysin n=1 Tax=Grimontia marina TaxID=646534 RepID=A0A128F5Q1_9GAMM|nr:imelysin family protein [Grimontia marina]CZF82113.1 Imelysin [Grimontia marina]
MSVKVKMKILTLFVTASLFSGCFSEAALNDKELAIWALQKHSANRFLNASQALKKSVKALCDAPTEEKLMQAQHLWLEAIKAWQPFVGGNSGNEAAMSVSWNIQFYPDKKNTTGRKLNQLLKKEAIPTADELSGQSVAVQGLGAIEWLLFDEADVATTATRCPLTVSVVNRTVQSSEALVSAWQSNPWRGASGKQLEAQTLRGLTSQLDAISKTLSLPMGKPGFPQPYQAQSWRSGQSNELLRVGLVSLQKRYESTLQPLLVEKGHVELATRLESHFDMAVESVPTMPAMGPLLADKFGYQSLMVVANHINYLQTAMSDEVGPTLGLVVGFNSTDGD